MLGACRLNNKSMRAIRREAAYQTMAIDLAMLGVISKEECEMLIGSGIPKGLLLPNGKAGSIISEKDLPKQPVVTENSETDITDDTDGTDGIDDTEGTDVPEDDSVEFTQSDDTEE